MEWNMLAICLQYDCWYGFDVFLWKCWFLQATPKPYSGMSGWNPGDKKKAPTLEGKSLQKMLLRQECSNFQFLNLSDISTGKSLQLTRAHVFTQHFFNLLKPTPASWASFKTSSQRLRCPIGRFDGCDGWYPGSLNHHSVAKDLHMIVYIWVVFKNRGTRKWRWK